MPVYTKTGDKGETSLANGQRVSKTDARIEAYGTVDELNSFIGLLRGNNDTPLLLWIQNKLFNLGAALSEAPGDWILDADVKKLESAIDELQSQIPALHSFVLPSGNLASCRCHICRTICRRAERRMIEAAANEIWIRFINRLSDYFFVLARYFNFILGTEEEVWKKD